jgi:hypothetical protein
MSLSVSNHALKNTYIGNYSVPVVPIVVPPEPIPEPIPDPTPEPIPDNNNTTEPVIPTKTPKLNNIQLGFVVGGSIVGFAALVVLVLYSVGVCKLKPSGESQADAENIIYTADRTSLMRDARARAVM